MVVVVAVEKDWRFGFFFLLNFIPPGGGGSVGVGGGCGCSCSCSCGCGCG